MVDFRTEHPFCVLSHFSEPHYDIMILKYTIPVIMVKSLDCALATNKQSNIMLCNG